MKITAECLRCKADIVNLSDSGRPDLWRHIEEDANRSCLTPWPNADVENAMPSEIRTIRLRVEETVVYDFTTHILVPIGVTPDTLVGYLKDHEDDWADRLGDEVILDTRDQEIDDEETRFADTEYLARVRERVAARDRALAPWIITRCPACADVPDEYDGHIVVDGCVVVSCEGEMVINPAILGLNEPAWEDWTKDADVIEPAWKGWAADSATTE